MKAVASLLLRLQKTTMNVFFTSRPDVVIWRVWSSDVPGEDGKAFELAISPTLILSRHLEMYVSDELDRLINTRELTLRDPALKLEVIKSLVDRSDGM
jgi:hypothetical protein